MDVSTNMGNLEKLGILVIVILVVVVGVVAITPKSTVDDRLYAPSETAAATETPLEPATPPAEANPWPPKDGAIVADLRPLPSPGAPATTPALPVAPTTRTAKVLRGDTLAVIAKRELGSAALYQQVLDANPGLNATKLSAGMEIQIPVASTTAPVDPMAVTPAPQTPAVAEEKTYVVKKGDTLSSIASREMGGKAKWGELAKANEDVLHGSTALKIGMKLKIPGAAATAPSTEGTGGMLASRDVAATAPASEREYTVKSGDSLWGIAKHELGSETMLKDLKAANADVLKGGDSLKVGMKLKLPSKK
jgi:nucleoid-associated protein YgaU